jgi:hypothetical protein
MAVHLALLRILIRATKSLAKRAFVVPSALVAVPATVKSFSVIMLPFKVAYLSLKNVVPYCSTYQYYSKRAFIGQVFLQ